MTKEEILNYVMDTPDNTNRMVLSDMLDEFSSGGGASILVVGVTEEGSFWNCDKTWQEIYEAFLSGSVRLSCPVFTENAVDYRNVIVVSTDGSQYDVYFWDGLDINAFHASSADGYPSLNLG